MLVNIDPYDAIPLIVSLLGQDQRLEVMELVTAAWVEQIPEQELDAHYASAVQELDTPELARLASLHEEHGLPRPPANRQLLIKSFHMLGDHRRKALHLVAELRMVEAWEGGASERDVLELVLPWFEQEQLQQLLGQVMERYCAYFGGGSMN